MTQEEIIEYVSNNEYSTVEIQIITGNPMISQVFNNFLWELPNGAKIMMYREYDSNYIIQNETYTYINGND